MLYRKLLYRDASVWKGLAAGLAGGLAAAWVMNQYQKGWSKVAAAGNGHPRPSGKTEASATEKTASAIAENVFHQKLPENQKKPASSAVHYILGSAIGAAYGVTAEFAPKTTIAAGLPFGAAVWLGADEVAVPLLHLGPSASDTSLSTHAYALSSHLVYGAVTDGIRRLVRRAWR